MPTGIPVFSFWEEIMAEGKEKLPGEAYCFACGPENPIGLHLDFHFADDKYIAEKAGL